MKGSALLWRKKQLFPREEKSEILFKKISEDKWACEKLMETFCSYLFSNDGVDLPDSPSSTEFAQALFNSYRNRDLSAFLMAICQNTVFDLLRNAFLIPYRFNADGKQNPMIMTDENGMLLPEYKRSIHEREYRHFHEVYTDLGAPKIFFWHKHTATAILIHPTIWNRNKTFWKRITVYC